MRRVQKIAAKLLYFVNHSYPYSSNGYAVRTHGVASALVQAGIEVIVVARSAQRSSTSEHRIDGVRYLQIADNVDRGIAYSDSVGEATKSVVELLRVFRPQAVMAASNWRNALPVANAAAEVGLPFFYEVRGFWEISQLAKNPAWKDSPEYAQTVDRETQVALLANRVYTLNRLMCAELIDRGVPEDRIELIPNGFSPMRPAGEASDLSVNRYGVQSKYLIGYVGSFNTYEGLEDLVRAISRLRQQGLDVSLMLVGSSTGARGVANEQCPLTERYRQLAANLGVADYLHLPGRVEPGQVAGYYAAMDLVVIPRRPDQVSELVTPMKPLEAAARGKRVLMSDVAALADLKGLCPHFSFFRKGDVADLTERVRELLLQGDFAPGECKALAELSWQKNVAPIVRFFNEVRS